MLRLTTYPKLLERVQVRDVLYGSHEVAAEIQRAQPELHGSSLAIHIHVARTVCTHILLEILELRNTVMTEVELFQSLQLFQALDLGYAVGLHRQDLQTLERAKVLKGQSVQVDPAQGNGRPGAW
jgi:hypothetical protein